MPRPVIIRAHAAFHLDRDFSEALRQLSSFLDSIGIASTLVNVGNRLFNFLFGCRVRLLRVTAYSLL